MFLLSLGILHPNEGVAESNGTSIPLTKIRDIMKNQIKTNFSLFAATFLFLAAGCATERSSQSKGPAAMAVLAPTQGNNVKGTVTFTQQKGGVRIVADVDGLTPGEHGFHIHEKGDCSAPDAASAGGHFNP